MAIVQRKPSSGTASKIASCLSFLTSSEKWSPIRLILVTYQPETSWVISTRAKHKLETLPEGPQTVIVVFAMRNLGPCAHLVFVIARARILARVLAWFPVLRGNCDAIFHILLQLITAKTPSKREAGRRRRRKRRKRRRRKGGRKRKIKKNKMKGEEEWRTAGVQ